MDNLLLRICPKDESHGQMRQQIRTNGRKSGWVCKVCFAEYVFQKRNGSDEKTKKLYSDTRKRSREKTIARNNTIVSDELAKHGGKCIHPGCDATYIEWHHKEPKNKRYVISQLVRGGGSVSRLKEELAKCEPLCPEHHRSERRLYHG